MRVVVEVHGAGNFIIDSDQVRLQTKCPNEKKGKVIILKIRKCSDLVEYLMRPSLYILMEVGAVWRVGFLSATAWSMKISGTQIILATSGWRGMNVLLGCLWLSGRLSFLISILSSLQYILKVVSSDTVPATSLTSRTFRRFIENFTSTGNSFCGAENWKFFYCMMCISWNSLTKVVIVVITNPENVLMLSSMTVLRT